MIIDLDEVSVADDEDVAPSLRHGQGHNNNNQVHPMSDDVSLDVFLQDTDCNTTKGSSASSQNTDATDSYASDSCKHPPCPKTTALGDCSVPNTSRPTGVSLPFVKPSVDFSFPDLHSLFVAYNHEYFGSSLDAVEVRWSTRMTLCAGLCVYQAGGYCSIRLSEPLLKFRPVDNMKETLLHEMIHAYLFVTKGSRDRDGHGPDFQQHMRRLNDTTGLNITIFHNFVDEVDYHRTHVWRCNGRCRDMAPRFGWLKRAMNRPPGPTDWWWQQHVENCGGAYIKIAEPPPKKTPAPKMKRSLQSALKIKKRQQSEVSSAPPVLSASPASSSASPCKPAAKRPLFLTGDNSINSAECQETTRTLRTEPWVVLSKVQQTPDESRQVNDVPVSSQAASISHLACNSNVVPTLEDLWKFPAVKQERSSRAKSHKFLEPQIQFDVPKDQYTTAIVKDLELQHRITRCKICHSAITDVPGNVHEKECLRRQRLKALCPEATNQR